jgi:hypothetical protein
MTVATPIKTSDILPQILTEIKAEMVAYYIVALFASRMTGQACGLKIS